MIKANGFTYRTYIVVIRGLDVQHVEVLAISMEAAEADVREAYVDAEMIQTYTR